MLIWHSHCVREGSSCVLANLSYLPFFVHFPSHSSEVACSLLTKPLLFSFTAPCSDCCPERCSPFPQACSLREKSMSSGRNAVLSHPPEC